MLKKEKAAKINPMMAHTGAIINKSILSQSLQIFNVLKNFNTSNLPLSLKNQSQFAG
jgi:hypothetical protein